MTVTIDSERVELEAFIAGRFRAVYGARVGHFCAHLFGLRDATGAWQAAAGYTPAASGPLYLEHYLDRPVEEVLSSAMGERVPRGHIIEVGNLAAANKGFGKTFVPLLARHLRELDYRWVVFTATREVRGLLERLSFEPRELAPAAPERLPDGGAGWGSYYAHEPCVMGGYIA